MEKATFGAGCFWGVEVAFANIPGVTATAVGYEGGKTQAPTYKDVCTDATGHAEVVEVDFDPARVTYGQLLDSFFKLHDPTQLNRQGPDTGTQYRSAIFPTNDDQAKVAKAYIAQLNQARVYKSAIVTKIEMNKSFYAAENYHQDYLTLHPREQYIAYNDIPKVQELAKMYPGLYSQDPVLVFDKNKKK